MITFIYKLVQSNLVVRMAKTKRTKKPQVQQTVGFEDSVKSFVNEMESGLFGEQVVSPTAINFGWDSEKNADWVEMVGEDGAKHMIYEKPAIKILGYYFRANLVKEGLTSKQFFDMTWEDRNKLINKWLQEKPRTFKLQLDPQTEEILFIRSGKFEQVSWKDVFGTVSESIREVYNGSKTEFVPRLKNAWNFKMPVTHEYLEFWVEVYAGSNIGFAKHKSLMLAVRAQTVKALKGMEAACFNWCTFGTAARWFGFDTKHIRDIIPSIDKITTRAIHLKGEQVAKVDKEQLVKLLAEQKTALEEALPKLDEYIHFELSPEDIQGIIDAYNFKYSLPKYVLEDLKDLIKEPTVFGLSNAFSFFRTHCDYKRSKKPREEAGLTRTLEKIAGELIVVSPLIKNIKEKYGKIEKGLLLDPKAWEEANEE